MHAKILSQCVSNFVLIAQAVFLLERRRTHKVTDATVYQSAKPAWRNNCCMTSSLEEKCHSAEDTSSRNAKIPVLMIYGLGTLKKVYQPTTNDNFNNS